MSMPYAQHLFSQNSYTKAQDIANLLQKYRCIGITAHANPDADALGSTLALAHGLQSLGKTVYLCNASPIPDYLAWLPYTGPLLTGFAQEEMQPEVVVVLDCGDSARLGDVESTVLSYPTINIDHHLDNPQFGSEYNWTDPHMAATGQMVAAILYALNVPLSNAVGQCIYMAVSSDTGNLSYGNTTEDVFLLCAHLMHEGLDMPSIREHLDNTWHLQRMHLWGELMQSLQTQREGTIALVTVSLEQLKKHNATKEDLEGFSEHLRRLGGVLMSGFVREDGPTICKASLRSSGPIDVRAVASTLGGGGHRNAAGATLKYDLASSQEKIFAAMTKWLDDHEL